MINISPTEIGALPLEDASMEQLSEESSIGAPRMSRPRPQQHNISIEEISVDPLALTSPSQPPYYLQLAQDTPESTPSGLSRDTPNDYAQYYHEWTASLGGWTYPSRSLGTSDSQLLDTAPIAPVVRR